MEEERKKELRAVLSFVIALAVLASCVGAAALMIRFKRVAEQEETERLIPGVEEIVVRPADHPVRLRSQGAVESVRVTTLGAEIAGRVTEISPALRRGAVVAEDEVLVRIDPADYLAAEARAAAALADAELALAQEEARGEQARLDWQRLGGGTEGRTLVLREPQLAAARAAVASARAEAGRAARDLERTEVRAPFAAAVRSTTVESGMVVSPGQALAELFSASELEVRLPLNLEDLGYLALDPEGAPSGEIILRARLGGEDRTWSAIPRRIDREVDRRTLSGHLVVAVEAGDDPAFPLPPVGLFVEAEIAGRTLENVVEVPRRAIRETGDVLVIDDDGRIEFRPLDILRTTRETAIVGRALRDGERVCLTRLNAPVAGMEVRVEARAESPESEIEDPR